MTAQKQLSTPIWENVEAEILQSSLTQTEYVIRGGRSHLFLLLAGQATLHMEETINEIQAPIFVWVPQGVSSKFAIKAGTRGMVVSIPELQLGVSLPSGSLGVDVRAALAEPIIKKPDPGSTVKQLQILTDTIHEELYNNAPATQDVVRYNLTLLLIQIWRASSTEITRSTSIPRSIFQNFVSLVELHITDHWTVTAYADHIGVTKDRLTSAVQRATGRSPLAEIHRKLFQEAEMQLLTSPQQISEIAYKLGFKDAAYFNRFFRKHAGMSPGQFRTKKQEQIPPKTFAAWP
ncbi:helix-turn-helix domain-containing protein [Sneathiella limimaris]|uniref:helix-turn-helix domain-containing protein n=1 Tax=Sneathiella limimaris TaxID=1964213 RepID=UPI00146B1E57|nr:helix-turn-helix domain-containing protein [Sneathiella limimaris]